MRSNQQVRAYLSKLNETYSWRTLGKWFGIPFGTLASIASGGKIPGRYRGRLGQVPLGKMSVKDLKWSLENRA